LSTVDQDRAAVCQRPRLMVTVVVCAYTEARWVQTCAALESVLAQSPGPDELILVVDHNQSFADRARRELPLVTVLESEGPRGLSGARNTGLKNASHPVTVFLDDDAEARPGWLAALVGPYECLNVVATGGSVHPRWPGRRPRWLPATFDWVVGCTYLGLPEAGGVVRNPIGANMSVRTAAALNAGGFDTGVGRIGNHPRGCEETELAIRLTKRRSDWIIYYAPDAAVDHHVAPERLGIRYFLRRCWYEGQSKADVVRLSGASAGLRSERRHVAVVIPSAIMRDVRAAISGEVLALARAAAAAGGLAVTASGYLTKRISFAVRRRLIRRPIAGSRPTSVLPNGSKLR
jgi:cellulose synthase/poly-beta-1,6-N-acetylglucosamine synthase-like glycosyltransferase